MGPNDRDDDDEKSDGFKNSIAHFEEMLERALEESIEDRQSDDKDDER